MRRTVRILIGLALALLAAGCSSALSGHGSALTPGQPSSSVGSAGPSSALPSGAFPSGAFPSGAFPSGGTVPSGTAPSSPSSASAAQLAQLTALLEPRPAGAVALADAWGSNVNPTLEQFAVHDYATSYVPTAEALLRAEGLTGIAHRTWTSGDGTQADVVLLQFATANGALSRFLFASRAKGESPGEKQLTVPDAGDTLAYYASALDSNGYIRAIVYSHRGTIEAQTFVFSPAHLNTADTIAWSKAQLARLP